MNSLIVVSWVGVGAFVAWIGTHMAKDQSRGAGIGNLAVCVLGALLGGLGAHAVLHGRHGYNAFTFCAGGAFTASVLLLIVTRFVPRRARPYVSRAR
jgi:uncharacterized membrane protein YeaQ/YmgE (transglycosylase-associated protein family)